MDFLDLPKADLHLHMEGAIPDCVFRVLARKYSEDISQSFEKRVLYRKSYNTFSEFMQTWVGRNRYLREYDDIRYASAAVAKNLVKQHVRYAELHFSPYEYECRGLDVQQVALAIRAGLDAETDRPIVTNLIIDLVRDYGSRVAVRVLDMLREVAEAAKIVAIGLGGTESSFPAEAYSQVFAKAEALGFHRVAHAGEGCVEAIWDVIHHLGIERIGHGTRAYEDARLIEYLRAHSLPLEICLSSSYRCGSVSSIASHPLRQYYRLGVPCVLATDDPAMFRTTLVKEFRHARGVLGNDDRAVIEIARRGFEAAFVSGEQRDRFLSEYDAAVGSRIDVLD